MNKQSSQPTARNMQLIKATVQYLENGLPRQKPFEAANEEKLMEAVFWFNAENYPCIEILKICYQGKIVEWKGIYTMAHYWLGEGHISFEQFKEYCLDKPEKVTA